MAAAFLTCLPIQHPVLEVIEKPQKRVKIRKIPLDGIFCFIRWLLTFSVSVRLPSQHGKFVGTYPQVEWLLLHRH